MAPKKQPQKRERDEAAAPASAAAPATTVEAAAVPAATTTAAVAPAAPTSPSAHAAPAPAPAVPTVAAPVIKKKNTQRLTRSFRQPKEKIPLRPWRPEGSTATTLQGITSALVAELVASLTEGEKQRAAQGLDPLTSLEEQMLKRAEKYGTLQQAETAATTGATTPATTAVAGVDPTVIQAREARFGTVTAVAAAPTASSTAAEEAAKKREARFATATAAGQGEGSASNSGDKDAFKAAMEARAKRFTA